MKSSPAAAVLAALLACACSGIALVPGEARIEDVEGVMGPPAMIFREPDGSQRLAYPGGPFGYRTIMADIAPDGRLLSIGNVLDAGHFARIAPGMSMEDVLRTLGPPAPERTMYFSARDELAWDWRYCDDWSRGAYFSVLFDASRGTVRSTLSIREDCGFSSCPCAH